MPARSEFFKRAVFGRKRAGFGCFRAGWATMRAASWKGTSELVAPHELSSKFLLRMRGQDCSPALAFLDQQAILRQVCRGIYARANCSGSVSGDCFAGCGRSDWTRDETATAATCNRATRQYTGGAIECGLAGHSRRRLHLWRADQERHTLLATRAWTSKMLAAQRTASDAARREAARY